MPSTISIDSAYAPEIVEFWVHKYQQIKEELEQAKALDNVGYYPYSIFPHTHTNRLTTGSTLRHRKNKISRNNQRHSKI
jgi:hypothetical protein